MVSVAMKLVVDAFLEVKRNPLLRISTESRNAQEAVEYFVKLFQNEDVKAKLDKFSCKWIGLMQHRISKIPKPLYYKGVGKEKACRFLLEHKTKDCNDLWITFMKEMNVSQKYYDDPLLIQLICDHVFHSIIKLELPEPTMPETLTPTISLEEKNAVCYAAGYVLRSIKLKLSKTKSNLIRFLFLIYYYFA